VKLYRTSFAGVVTSALGVLASTGLLAVGMPASAQTASISVTPGIISTFAGNGTKGSTGDTGQATLAELNAPESVASDAAGNIYILDSANYKVREVTPSGIINTIAGTGTKCTLSAAPSCGDTGQATKAQLGAAVDIYVTANGVLYIADTGDNEIRMVSGGIINTIAGTGTIGSTGNGGLATAATLNGPRGVYVDPVSGIIYIADSANGLIRTVSGGIISAYAGGGTGTCTGATDTLGDGCQALSAKLSTQVGTIWKDAAGNLYFSDNANERVRKITPAGIITTVAGNGTAGFTSDGVAATTSELAAPEGVVSDAAGDLIIPDYTNNRIRYVNGSGIISTLAGNGTASATGDGGLASSATLDGPHGVVQDANGYIYEAGYAEARVRVINTLNSQMNFGSVVALQSSAAQTVTLTSTGAAALTISSITVPAQYKQVASGGTDCAAALVLQPLATCQLSVEFSPTLNGPFNATLQVVTTGTPGTVSIALTGSGIYNSTVSTTTLLNIAPVTTYSGQSVTLSASVTGAGGTPTGTVSFYSGSTLLVTEPLTSGATPVISTTALPVGTDSVTAFYNGDPTYKTSTSSATVVTVYAGPPTFTLTPGSTTETVLSGISAQDNMVIQALYGYSGNPVFSCSGLVANMNCIFYPSTVPVATNAKVTALLSISTNSSPPSINGRPTAQLALARGALLCLLVPSMLIFLPGRRKRLMLPLCMVCTIALTSMQGCGKPASASTNVATGTYNIVVQATDPVANITQSVTIAVTVQ